MGRGPWGESSGRLFYFQQELEPRKEKSGLLRRLVIRDREVLT